MGPPDRVTEFAVDAYGEPAELEHPREVAELVAATGADAEVVSAALLHDLVEDTDADVGSIAAEFGSRVAGCVAAMTEDESIGDYAQRKRAAREQARNAGRDVALIFVADKLSNARRMRRGAKRPDAHKVGHYRATLELMRSAYPDLPLLDELELELDALRADVQRSPA